MDFIKHPLHTRYIGRPLNWNNERDGKCEALSVHDRRDQQSGYPVMESAWAPSSVEEGIALATGYAQLRLGVFGHSHPVVYMTTAPATPASREDYMSKLQRAAQWLFELAKQGNVKISFTDEGAKLVDKEEA